MAVGSRNVAGEIGMVCVPASAVSLEGFRAWAVSADFPGQGRLTFVNNGVLIDMSPEDLETHNMVKTEIVRVLAGLNRELRLGILCSDRMLVSNTEAGISTEPDAMLITRDAIEAGRAEFVQCAGRPHRSKELVGSPTWILEVVSRSSLAKDKKLLREAYHRAGVAEYWLIDALGEAIDFQLLVRQTDGYMAAASRDGWLASPVFGQLFHLEREEDEQGFWQYTLHARQA